MDGHGEKMMRKTMGKWMIAMGRISDFLGKHWVNQRTQWAMFNSYVKFLRGHMI